MAAAGSSYQPGVANLDTDLSGVDESDLNEEFEEEAKDIAMVQVHTKAVLLTKAYTRTHFLNGNYTPEIAKHVFERGRQNDGNVYCYLCGTAKLDLPLRVCKCPSVKECGGCGAWQLEHIRPLSKAGPDVMGNLLPACHSCNSKSWKSNHRIVDCINLKGMNVCTWAVDNSSILTTINQTVVQAVHDKHARRKERLRKVYEEVKANGVLTNLCNSFDQNDLDMDECEPIGQGKSSHAIFKVPYKPVKQTKGKIYVVIKALSPKFQTSDEEKYTLVAEAVELERCRHPNVLRLLGAFDETDEGGFSLVLEYHKKTLDSWMRSKSLATARNNSQFKNAADQFIYMLHGVARGLSHMHSLGRVHRDIKPMNILVSEFGDGILADLDGVGPEGSPTQVGTAGYIDRHSGGHTCMHDIGVYGYNVRACVASMGTSISGEQKTALDELILNCTCNVIHRWKLERIIKHLRGLFPPYVNAILEHSDNYFANLSTILPTAVLTSNIASNAVTAIVSSPIVVPHLPLGIAPVVPLAVHMPPVRPTECRKILLYSKLRRGQECGRSKPCRYHG